MAASATYSFGHKKAYLDTPSNVSISNGFVAFTGMDPGLDDKYDFLTVPDSIPGLSYNIGHTNMNTGKSVGYATNLDQATGLRYRDVTPGVLYGVRVSTYSTTGYGYFSGDHI